MSIRWHIGALGLGVLLAGIGGQALAQDRLVIAGRDGPYGEALSLMAEGFKEQHPGLEIELLELPYGGLYEKLVIGMREGAAAYDVVLLDDTWAPEFMARGWLADLDELGNGLDEDFVESAVRVSRHPYGEGTLHAVPFVGNVELFAYRSDLLEEHGFGKPESWSEVLDAAKTISEQEEGVHGVVFRGTKGNPIVTGFLPILWAHGGQIVDDAGNVVLDSDASRQALELFLELKEYAPEGVATYNATEVRDALQTGTAAISIELWPAWAPSLDDPEVSQVPGKIEIMAAPGEVEGPSPMLGAWLLAVPADAPSPELARDFIDFVTSPDNQKLLAIEVGMPPTRESVYGDPEVVETYRWYPQQLEALKDAQPRPRIADWSRVETILGDYLQLALIGQLSVDEALEEAHAEIARALGS